MSRRRRTDARADARERVVAEVWLDAVEALPTGPCLLVGDRDGHAEGARAARGHQAVRWARFARGDRPGTAWPPAEDYASAAIRVPPSHPALELALHAVADRLAPGAPLWVYGANDEGIRSVARRLSPLFDAAETVATRRKCRVWQALRTTAPARAPLSAWRLTTEMRLPTGARPWTEFPGVFARGRLDPGTALLLEVMAPTASGEVVLDFACGAGAIAATLAARAPATRLHLLDADAIALEAARLNVPSALALHSGDGWRAAPALKVDRVVSNPPIHRGKGEDYDVLAALIAQAPKHLRRGGRLELVVQRQVPVRPWLEAAFDHITRVAETPRFHVWSAR